MAHLAPTVETSRVLGVVIISGCTQVERGWEPYLLEPSQEPALLSWPSEDACYNYSFVFKLSFVQMRDPDSESSDGLGGLILVENGLPRYLSTL